MSDFADIAQLLTSSADRKTAVPVLISVRNVAEATVALNSGVVFLDVKEPSRGSLGAADADTIAAIAEAAAGQAFLSIAGGELLNAGPVPNVSAWAIKVGLAGCRWCPDWPGRLERLAQSLGRHDSECDAMSTGPIDHAAVSANRPFSAQLVPVAYADFEAANAPAVLEVFQTAIVRRWPAVMLDTYLKNGRCVFDYLAPDFLADWALRLRRAGVVFGLAGALRLEHASTVFSIRPALVAFRSAACQNHTREQSLCAERIRQLLRCFGHWESPFRSLLAERTTGCLLPAPHRQDLLEMVHERPAS